MDAAGVDAFDWLIWRVYLCPAIKDSLDTIKRRWTLADLAEGHIAVDVHEALQPDPPKPTS